jgi:hypothetical protein
VRHCENHSSGSSDDDGDGSSSSDGSSSDGSSSEVTTLAWHPLWKRLKQAGWFYERPGRGNFMVEWYYARPGRNVKTGTEGVDFFTSDKDVNRARDIFCDIRCQSEPSKLISALSALAAFTDCAPNVFGASARGNTAVKFALENILMGVNHADEDGSYDSNEASDQEDRDKPDTPSSSRKKRAKSTSKNKQGR